MDKNEILRTALLRIRSLRRDGAIPDHELDSIYIIANDALNYEEEVLNCEEKAWNTLWEGGISILRVKNQKSEIIMEYE